MIYVLGSINMDMVMTVPYLPKNGETLSADKFYVNPGGKGANQAVAIAKLGGDVKMIGKVGRDANGRALKENLSSFGVDAACVTETDVSSGLAMIMVEGGDNRIILYKAQTTACLRPTWTTVLKAPVREISSLCSLKFRLKSLSMPLPPQKKEA